MLVFRHQERHQHIDIEEGNHGRRLFGTINETIDVFDLEDRGAWPFGEYRYAAHKTHVCISHTPEQGFGELIDFLAGLARKLSETCFDLGVHPDGSRRHLKPPKPFFFILAQEAPIQQYGKNTRSI
jgi:hypothetical protein